MALSTLKVRHRQRMVAFFCYSIKEISWQANYQRSFYFLRSKLVSSSRMSDFGQSANHTIPWSHSSPKARYNLPTTSIFSCGIRHDYDSTKIQFHPRNWFSACMSSIHSFSSFGLFDTSQHPGSFQIQNLFEQHPCLSSLNFTYVECMSRWRSSKLLQIISISLPL